MMNKVMRGAIALILSSFILGCQKAAKNQDNPVTEDSAVSNSAIADNAVQRQTEPVSTCLEDITSTQTEFLGVLLEAEPQKHYYVAFSTEGLEDPKDIGKIEQFTTIESIDNQCQELTREQSQAVAREFFQIDYEDILNLNEGRIESTWSEVVNRWERDHYVSGPGDHPLVVRLRDIWFAKTLDLSLPDYLPIYLTN